MLLKYWYVWIVALAFLGEGIRLGYEAATSTGPGRVPLAMKSAACLTIGIAFAPMVVLISEYPGEYGAMQSLSLLAAGGGMLVYGVGHLLSKRHRKKQ